MSFKILVQVEGDPSRAPRAALNALRNKTQQNRAMAEGALPVVQRQLLENSRTNRNKFGARGGFWQRMLAATRAGSDAEAGFISMPREVALRVYGGTVVPRVSKLLAIPARTEAYGKSPRQFADLHFIPTAKGGLLVQNDATRIKRKKRKAGVQAGETVGGGVFYFLVKRATIAPNRSLLPTDKEILTGASRGLKTWLEGQMKRGAR